MFSVLVSPSIHFFIFLCISLSSIESSPYMFCCTVEDHQLQQSGSPGRFHIMHDWFVLSAYHPWPEFMCFLSPFLDSHACFDRAGDSTHLLGLWASIKQQRRRETFGLCVILIFWRKMPRSTLSHAFMASSAVADWSKDEIAGYFRGQRWHWWRHI